MATTIAQKYRLSFLQQTGLSAAVNRALGQQFANADEMFETLFVEARRVANLVDAGSRGHFGDVFGPASATDLAIAVFDGTSGKRIKDSAVPVSAFARLTLPNTFLAPQTFSAGVIIAHGGLSELEGTFATLPGAPPIGTLANISDSAVTSGIVTGGGSNHVLARFDGTHWIVQGAGIGDVLGPSSAVVNRVAVFDGTTGKLIKDNTGIVALIDTALAIGTSPAASGELRLPAGGAMTWRSGSGVADACAIAQVADQLMLHASSSIRIYLYAGTGAGTGAQGNFYPQVDGTIDLGYPNLRFRAAAFTEYVAIGNSPATAGSVRLPFDGGILFNDNLGSGYDVRLSRSGATTLALDDGLGGPAILTAAMILTNTASPGDNSPLAATTAFVQAALAALFPISLTTQVTGTLQAAQEPAHTGDVTNSAGSLALTIGAGKVTNTMLAGSITASKLVQTDLVIAESQVTNLTTDLAAKAPLASPALTGTPTAPTASPGTNTTQIATTAFVQAAAGSLVEQSSSATGTQNDFSASSARTVLRCTGSSAVIFTGFTIGGAAPAAGSEITIENVGSSTVRVAHQDTGSTAANRIIGESTRGQIVGVNGSIRLLYDGTTSRWRIAAYNPGNAIAIPYSASDFTGYGTMTWTVDAGDVLTNQYKQWGTVLELTQAIISSTLGGTATQFVMFLLPNGFTFGVNQVAIAGRLFDTPNYVLGVVTSAISITTTQLFISRIDNANLTLVTNQFIAQTVNRLIIN
jgi:hypothetical protein